MGILDSSRTRVAPVFDRLFERDPTGAPWLKRLLGLPTRPDGWQMALPSELGPLTVHRWAGHDQGEMRLPPPAALLEHLLDHRTPKPPPDFGTKDLAKRELRERLFAGDDRTLAEARALVRSQGFIEGGWYVFEGKTAVDVYLETPELIALIEGKRTERGTTTKTSWMPARHQILRNIDAVWDRRGSKAVVAFFIVEGEPLDGQSVPSRWQTLLAETVSSEALHASLPHRREERGAMADAFLGATTWQAVCSAFNIDWADIRDLTWEPRARRSDRGA